MSLDTKKQQIFCDSHDCAQNVALPITLSDTAAPQSRRSGRSSAAGWFFVASQDGDRHYCPRCGRRRFSQHAA